MKETEKFRQLVKKHCLLTDVCYVRKEYLRIWNLENGLSWIKDITDVNGLHTTGKGQWYLTDSIAPSNTNTSQQLMKLLEATLKS